MNDQEVRLAAILDWLNKGRITTEQAARRVRTLKFPPPPPGKTVFQRQQDDANGDPETPQAGSFFAISDAYAAGRISHEQYAALAAAATDAMRAQEPARQ